jgi:hypothetical protein
MACRRSGRQPWAGAAKIGSALLWSLPVASAPLIENLEQPMAAHKGVARDELFLPRISALECDMIRTNKPYTVLQCLWHAANLACHIGSKSAGL